MWLTAALCVGLSNNRGRPPASATPRVYANAIDDLFVMREQERDDPGAKIPHRWRSP
jgi:hypothetical protein